MAKIPLGMIQKYRFERNLQKIPVETKDELQTRIYGWQWMTYGITMLPKSRRLGGTNRKYRPWLPLDNQPGYCYLRLFKKELRELIDWPAFPTLLEICQWEVELRDDRGAEQRRQTTLEIEQRELETLKQLLEDVPEGPVHDALLNTWSNVFMLWNEIGRAHV